MGQVDRQQAGLPFGGRFFSTHVVVPWQNPRPAAACRAPDPV